MRFTDHLAGQAAPARTVRAYTKDVQLWFEWLTGSTTRERVDQLERWDASDYIVYIAKAGLEASSIRRKLAAIRKFTGWCAECGLLTVDPAKTVRGPRLRLREPVVLTAPEYKALLYEARNHPRDLAILQVFLQTGIREGELCALSVADIDIVGKEMHVHARKGGIDTVIPLSSEAMEALNGYLRVRPPAAHDRVFLSKSNRPLTERAIRFLVKQYLGTAGILARKPQACAHTLRHTFGAHKSARGVDVATLQYWMGHKKKETTLGYIHLVKAKAPEEMEATAL